MDSKYTIRVEYSTDNPVYSFASQRTFNILSEKKLSFSAEHIKTIPQNHYQALIVHIEIGEEKEEYHPLDTGKGFERFGNNLEDLLRKMR